MDAFPLYMNVCIYTYAERVWGLVIAFQNQVCYWNCLEHDALALCVEVLAASPEPDSSPLNYILPCQFSLQRTHLRSPSITIG